MPPIMLRSLLLRRLWSCSTRHPLVEVSGRRPLSVSAARRDVFTVQDEEDFRTRVLDSQNNVIVDFTAVWCPPCKILKPRLEAAVAATNGAVDLAVVDIDELGEVALDHDVQAVPTLMVVKKGQVTEKVVGLVDEDRLTALVEKAKM